MNRPGVDLIERDSPPSRTADTDTGKALLTGFTDKGPTAATEVTSVHDFVTKFGGRVSFSTLYDYLDAAFREGLARAIIARVVGPTPVKATANLYDAAGSTTPDVALVATANDYGDYANKLNVEAVAGSGGGLFEIVVSHDDDGELERSGDLVDRAAAVAWAAFSDNIKLTLGASNEDPRVQGPTGLTGGTDDHASATITEEEDALEKFNRNLGPGQVATPGRSTSALATAVLAHCAEFNRHAALDESDTTSEATLKAAAAALRDLEDARYGGIFGPWVIAPGIVASSTRTIPPSAYYVGQCARNDADPNHDPGEAIAGDNGRLSFVTDLRLTDADLTDADYTELNEAGVNMIKYDVAGNPEIYGNRTLVDPDDFPNHVRLSDMRALMAIRANAYVISGGFVFKQFDGQGRQLASYKNELVGLLKGYWDKGMLFGATADEAFRVNVGPDVNPLADLEAGIVKAAVSVRVSPAAELIQFILIKRPITQSVA